MDIDGYLVETEYSVAGIISLIWHEYDDLKKIGGELEALTRVVDQRYQQADSVAMNAGDSDDVAMATGMYWETYFGDDKKRHQKFSEASLLQSQIDARAFSVGSLCGSLLQVAKQGISVAHGGLGSCPDGRDVQGHTLKQVIWQGRNQSIHWEDGNPHSPVQELFDSLTEKVDKKFMNYRTRNCAFDIIELLNWRTLNNYRADMESLG